MAVINTPQAGLLQEGGLECSQAAKPPVSTPIPEGLPPPWGGGQGVGKRRDFDLVKALTPQVFNRCFFASFKVNYDYIDLKDRYI